MAELEITILNDSEDELEAYDRWAGSRMIELTDEHLSALRDGQVLACNDGEYAYFIKLSGD